MCSSCPSLQSLLQTDSGSESGNKKSTQFLEGSKLHLCLVAGASGQGVFVMKGLGKKAEQRWEVMELNTHTYPGESFQPMVLM
jgi:hypothetical protein